MIKFDKTKDKIAIIAPSSITTEAEAKFTAAITLLKENNFNVTYHPEIFSRKSLEFFAAKKHIRVEGVKKALEDPSVKIIWAFRGGYGATEILFDCYDFQPSSEKLLIGFSDITALHALFNNKFQLPSLHASVLTSVIGPQAAMFDEILSLFTTGKVEYELELLNEAATAVDRSINAPVIGGNLAVYCNLIGTKLHPDSTGKILILEDVDERGYEVHRYFMHLLNTGVLDAPAAIILGDFTDGDKFIEPSLDDICYRYLQSIPVYRLHGLGHGGVNHPIVLGQESVISGNKISCQSPLKLI